MNKVITAAIIALTSVAVARGWSIVNFVRAASLPQPVSSDADRDWIGTAGLTTEALDAALNANANANATARNAADATRRRIALLTAYLAVRPLSPVQWLSLAGMRLASGDASDRALVAVAMSSITGPNEAGVMWQRGVFGLLQWEFLPVDARSRSIADLSGVILTGALNDTEANEAATVASAKSPEVRSQVKSRLVDEGVPPAALQRIGL